MNKTWMILAVALSILGAVACGGDDAGTATSASTTGSDSTTSGSPAEIDVNVYFALNEAVGTAGRSVSEESPARAAIEALLEGPEGIETEMGMTSAIPEGTELLDLDISDGIATIDLSAAFESGGGSLSMLLRVAQVVFTLTQFESVDSVAFRLDGEAVDAIGGEGVMVDSVDRTDFTSVTPAVLIESPVPGASVTSPVEIAGMSNTFEGTVLYNVVDGEGLIVDDGFTTASAGNGTFGEFSITSAFDVDRGGTGAVIAFEESPRDGSEVNVYEVPVEIG